MWEWEKKEKKKKHFYQTGMSHELIHVRALKKKKKRIQKFKHSVMKLFLAGNAAIEVPEYSNRRMETVQVPKWLFLWLFHGQLKV